MCVCVCVCVCKIRNHYLLVDYTLTEAAVLAIMREGGEEAKGGVGGAQTRDGHVMLREATRQVMRNTSSILASPDERGRERRT